VCEIEEYSIYTYDENGREREYLITDMEKFLESQESLDKLLDELESRVGFQKDLKYGLENNFMGCYDEKTNFDSSEEEIEYLGMAIESNLKVIQKVREYLGLNPEPNIKPSILTIEFLKRNARYN
jgi:hypothetical protein